MFKRILKNTGWLVGAQVAAKVIGFFYLLYLARRVSLADFGWYTLALAYLVLLSPLVEFGLDRVILRDGARRRQSLGGLVVSAVSLKVVLVLAAGLILKILVSGFNYPDLMRGLLFLVWLGLLIRVIGATLEAGFQAQEKMWVSAAAMLVVALVSPLVGLPLFWRGFGLSGIMIGQVAAFGAGTTLVWLLALEQGWFRKIALPSRFRLKSLLCRSWPLALLSLLSLLTFRIDAVLLSKLVSPADLGLYNAAYKFVEIGVLLPAFLSLAAFPLFARLMMTDRAQLARIYVGLLTILAILAALVGLGVFAAGRFLITLFGSGFISAAPTLVILAWALGLIFLNAPAAPLIQSSEYLLAYLPVSLVLLGVNFGLNLWWIPTLGIQGAAWATLATEVIGFGFNSLFVVKILRSRPVPA